MVIIKSLYQLRKGENFAVICRAPAKKSHIVYDSLGQEALIDQILIGRMAASLGKLLMLLVGNQRAVNVYRHIPAKCLVKKVVFRCGRQVLISTNHMGDTHQMVVHNVGEVVGGIAVGFDQDHIVQLGVGHCRSRHKSHPRNGSFPRSGCSDG